MITKGSTFSSASNSIEIITNTGQEIHFISFINRDEAYKLIVALQVPKKGLDTEANTPDQNNTIHKINDADHDIGSLTDLSEENTGKIVLYEVDKSSKPPETLFFFADNATFPLGQTMELGGILDILIFLTIWVHWMSNYQDGNPTRKMRRNMSEMSMVVKIKGVPFRSKTRVQSTQYYNRTR